METAEEKAVTRPAQPPTAPALEVYRDMLVLKVVDQASCAVMVSHAAKLKKAVKGIEEWFEPMLTAAKVVTDAAKASELAVKLKMKESTEIFTLAVTTGQGSINSFLTADRERVKAETLLAEQKQAEEKKREQTEILETANVLENLGSTTAAASLREDAERIIDTPVFVPQVEKTIRTGGGVAAGGATMSQTVKTTYQVTDVRAFLKYLVDEKSAGAFIEFPVAKLNAWGKSQGIKAGEVPGLAVKEEVKSSIR